MDEVKLTFVNWKGFAVLDVPNVLEQLDKFSTEFESRDDDIWICGFHKCGTHFLNEILHMLKTGTTEPSMTKQHYFAEMGDQEVWKQLSSPRVFNTHLPYAALPEQVKKSKIVFALRNIKDVVVSYYHHIRNLTCFDTRVDWDNYFETILRDTPNSGSFYAYIKEWWSIIEKSPPNILIIRYEELLGDPIDHIRKMANFIGVERDEAFIKAVAKATQIDVMKKTHANDVFEVAGKNVRIAPIYRKGMVGDWRNHFTEDQNKRFNDRYLAEMKGIRLGIEQYMDY